MIMGSLWLHTGMLIAEVTVDDILNKMQQNIAGMNDMKAEIMTTAYMGGQLNTMTQRMNYYFKKPDKVKMETLTPIKQIMIIIGDKMTMKTADGKITTINLSQMLGMDPSQQYFGPDITKMLKNFDVTLNESLSDKVNNIYVIEFVQKQTTTNTSPVGTFGMPFKTQMFIDYTKGITIKQKIYGKDNVLIAITEVKDTRQIESVWLPIITESTAFLPNGQQVKSEMRFENVQVNVGIGDGEFERR